MKWIVALSFFLLAAGLALWPRSATFVDACGQSPSGARACTDLSAGQTYVWRGEPSSTPVWWK